MYTHPRLRPETNPYEAYTPEEYFTQSFEAKVANGDMLVRQAERILHRKGRVLELGCGEGAHLVAAAARGWQAFGIDMTPAFARHHSGVSIEISPVEEARSLEDRYDYVLLAAILEHLYDPVACLRRVRQALAPDGIVFIDVPNECSLFTNVGNAYFRLRRRDWVVNLSPTFPPFHVVGFCPRSLRRILAATGFEVMELVTHPWQNVLPPLPGLVGTVERIGVTAVMKLGARLGMGAGITCWARRTPVSSASL